jgi:hypothetical protein
MFRKPAQLPGGLSGRQSVHFSLFFSKNMTVASAPIAARGEVTIALNGQPLAVRFSLAVLHDYTTTTGTNLVDIGEHMSADLLGTIGHLLAAAVRRATRKPFDVNDALDLMEELPQAEGDAIAAAIWAAIKVDTNPLLSALIAQAPKPAPDETNGASTDGLPSVS